VRALFRCIICLEIFDHSRRSEEHVFPDSMGGTWKIYDLCKPCNERLGENADGPVANDFWVKVARQRFKIEGKTGVPNPFDRIAIVERKHYGAPWQTTAARWEGNYLYRHPKRWPDGEMVYDSRDAHKAAADAQKMRFRRPDAPPVKVRVTDPNRHSGVIEVPITSHPSLCARGLLKIVYEFAYRLLGYSYLWDSHGQLIRRFLHSGETDHTRLALWHVFTSHGVLPMDGNHQAELIGGLARDGQRTIGYVRVFDRHDSVIEVSGRPWPSIDDTGVAFVFDVEKKTERATDFRALGLKV
jgi:hypothetical protein